MWKLYGNVAGEPTLNVYALSVYVFTMVFSISRMVAGLQYSLNREIKELHHALRNEKISY